MVPDACEKTKEGSLHEPAVARELPVRSADRDRSPVAACGPRQHPWKITHTLVFARPLRAGTARGPNLIGSWSQCMRRSESGLSMNRDSQTRMTNDQIRRNDQIRMTKPATAQLRAIGHSGFGFLSSFVVRHSTAYAIRFMVLMHARKTKEGFP